MSALGLTYIACLAVIFSFVLLTPDHTIDGIKGKLSFGGLFCSGLALAIHALAP